MSILNLASREFSELAQEFAIKKKTGSIVITIHYANGHAMEYESKVNKKVRENKQVLDNAIKKE